MSTSTSDQDMSDASNMSVSNSYWDPRNSPSQQVPQLTGALTELSCVDLKFHVANEPYLRITEQPQDHFRFRYVSEMVGTHGCLLGKSSTSTSSKPKTHPTVELVNYSGQALIRCQLAQHKSSEEHPHRLLEDDRDKELSYHVPEQGSYKVCFAGLGIIHTAKKDVSELLQKRYIERHGNRHINAKELKSHCDTVAKNIDLNIVRLKFSAHDVNTGKEICQPVFSEPIHNMKSASTNDLKICRISRCSGRPRGGDDVFILVEKVNKKNIQIRFYELDENGDQGWTAFATFLQSDVHHQYAIVFRTPAYKDDKIPEDAKVYIELVRPSDGRCSERKEFVYKAEQVYKSNKKRKTTSSYSSLDSSSGSSIKSLSDLPTTVFINNNVNATIPLESPVQKFLAQGGSSPDACELGSALMDAEGSSPRPLHSPMWGATGTHIATATGVKTESIPNLVLESTEFEKLLAVDANIVFQDNRQVNSDLLKEYMTSLPSVDDLPYDETSSMEFIRSLGCIVADSGRGKVKPVQIHTESQSAMSTSKIEMESSQKNIDKKKEPGEYNAMYTADDGEEVKKLVKELCDAIRGKQGYKTAEIRSKLERLFDIRLSNGDTFLHMTLCSNLPSFESIVKLINKVKMSKLFNYSNDKQQTILHLAVMNDMPKIVTLLVDKGCNPMLKDIEDENAIHYAVRSQNCLEPLLDAIDRNNISCDLNDSNNERQTPLHLAAKYHCSFAGRALAKRGGRCGARDLQGRTPLHIAACDRDALFIQAILPFVGPDDIDAVDGSGNTALQIVCSRPVNENSLSIVKMLLTKKVDPLKHEEYNLPAMKLARDKPEIFALFTEYVPTYVFVDDVKSEPEDEFESADEYEMEACDSEGASGKLEMKGGWVCEVCALLDGNGKWRPLAKRANPTDHLAQIAHLEAQPSPTLALLNHIKDHHSEITAKSLAVMLEDLGENDAASIIRQHID